MHHLLSILNESNGWTVELSRLLGGEATSNDQSSTESSKHVNIIRLVKHLVSVDSCISSILVGQLRIFGHKLLAHHVSLAAE